MSPRTIVGIVLLVILINGACSRKSSGPPPDLIVLQTGRLRGNVYPEGVRKGVPLQYYPYIAGYVKKVRAEAVKTATPVLLLDLGDSLTGSFAASVTNSANVVQFFNETGYDAVMLGNLDGDVNPEAIKALRMPVLCPFQGLDGTPAMPGTMFFAKFTKGNVPIELLANFYGDTRQEDFPERFPGVFGPSGVVKPFRGYDTLPKPGNGVLRIFEWLKFEHDGNAPPALLGSLRSLGVGFVTAHRVYGSEKIDTWSQGAVNDDWEPPVSENVLRNNGGFALARADLKRDGARWKIVRQEVLPMVSNTARADYGIAEGLMPFAERISQANVKLAPLKDTLSKDAILKLYLKALAALPGTSAAAYSPEGIRSGWSRGDLYTSDVFSSVPWSNPLVQIDLTPMQFEALRAGGTMRLLVASNPPPDGIRTVSTSAFFAKTLVQRLHLEPSAVRNVAAGPEYVFFVNYLKSLESIGKIAPLDGWDFEGEGRRQ